MNRLLFVDYLRRNRVGVSIAAVLTAVLWYSAAMGGGLSPQGVVAGSLAIALITGPLQTFAGLAPPVIRLLPVSRRSIWRTGWWLSVIVTTGVMATGKLVALALAGSSRSSISLDTVWVSSVCELAQAGTVLFVLRAIPAASGPAVSRMATVVRISVLAFATVAFLVTMAWPFIVLKALPVSWSQVSGIRAVVVFIGLAMTVASYFAWPARVLAPNRRAARASWQGKGQSWMPRFTRVTGLWRIALYTWMSAIVMQIVVPLLVIGATAAVNVFFDPEPGGWLANARDYGFLPFDTNGGLTAHSNFVILFMLGSMSASWPLAMLGNSDVLQFMLRHLRTLPLSTRRLNGVILAVPVISWVNLWLLLALFHVVVTGRPFASLRLAEGLALIGCDALARAMYLKWRTYLWPGILAVVALTLAFLVMKRAFGAFPTFAAALGVITLFSAWAMNNDTLTKSRLAYTPTKALGPRGMATAAGD